MPLAAGTIRVEGLDEAGASLDKFNNDIADLPPFWRELGSQFSEDEQARWPLRRRTGRLRESLRWAGNRLGRGGVYEATPDRLRFGTGERVFYARYHQFGARHLPRRPLIHIDEARTRTTAIPRMVRENGRGE